MKMPDLQRYPWNLNLIKIDFTTVVNSIDIYAYQIKFLLKNAVKEGNLGFVISQLEVVLPFQINFFIV